MKRYAVINIVWFTTLLLFICFPAAAQTTDGCTAAECHANIVTPVNIHPAMEDDCTSCHEESGSEHPSGSGKDITLADEVPALCYMCHDEKNIEAVVHSPVEAGDCTDCHSPHSSDSEYLLLQRSVKETCNQCHDISDQKGIYHSPVEDGMCTDCHNPHQSSNAFLLLEESPSLCYTCHDDLITTEITKSVHPPFEEDCLDCHNPHSSDNDYLMEETVPDLCYFCHDDPNELENVSSIHNAINLEKKCMNCHSPHSSTNSNLLLKEEIELCLSCHNKEIKSEDKTIENISKKIKVEEEAHPPVVMDGCSTCHNPHSSQSGSLLLDKFPTGNYASGFEGNYSLCFTCHDEEAFTDEETTNGTYFRNGNVNLHFLHVNQEKSRSCSNCHDIHGSKKKHLIKEFVGFGNWKMKINYSESETGGSCLPGCHAEKKYNR